MKSCDEMVGSLLERRDKYAAEQKRKRAAMARAVTCVCLTALLGIGVWQSGMIRTALSNEQKVDDAVYPGTKDTFDQNKGESPDDPAANTKIIVHRMSGIPANKMNINLAGDDFVEMTQEEMIQYYGVDYIPDVPADMKPWEKEKSGIFRRNGGAGEVYWDADILNYSNEDFTRNLCLEADKGSSVLRDYVYFDGTEKKSVINNVEVLIGVTDDGCYYAEFMYKEVGFLLEADGVTQDEFVSVISSLIQ